MEHKTRMAGASEIMLDFAERTGLSTKAHPPQRYLWTDAFAVCNFLGLYQQTGEERYRDLALKLIAQVHDVLGRFNTEDVRSGWISGLDEAQAKIHPTAGGLRIGKKLAERGPDDAYDETLEWDRDGQYFHYLTKWMHALERAGVITGEPEYCRWAIELATVANARFVYTPPGGSQKRMFWKMSVDLSRPLVASMGLHDPLDGFLTYHELAMCAHKTFAGAALPGLDKEISTLEKMCEGANWQTEDALGIGGLLFDAGRVFQLILAGHLIMPGLLRTLLSDAHLGLDRFVRQNCLNNPADYRLAFRELGLSIGLRAIPGIRDHLEVNSKLRGDGLSRQLKQLMHYVSLSDIIEDYWCKPARQQSQSWLAHRDINAVMLATSLAPDTFLSL